jgi:enoyl-CoA hydratase/carnithine racemase
MPYEELILEKREEILIITLNRPQSKNALSPKLVQELASVFHSVGHHGHSARAIVIWGGSNNFCAGLDLKQLSGLSEQELDHFLEQVESIFMAILHSHCPIIAAIDGPAIAAGFDLAVMCDLRLASPRARFGQPEITIGITPLIDPLWKIIGLGRARELNMTGMIYDAEEAYRIGLINRLVPSEEIFNRAVDLARELANKNPHALGAIKEMARLIPGMETSQAMKNQFWIFRNFVNSESKRKDMERYL